MVERQGSQGTGLQHTMCLHDIPEITQSGFLHMLLLWWQQYQAANAHRYCEPTGAKILFGTCVTAKPSSYHNRLARTWQQIAL